MSDLFDEELIGEFVAESRDHLDAIEPDLLDMERQGGVVSDESLNRTFRAIHSIKGGAGFLAYESLKNLSHRMESVLCLYRDGELADPAHVTDVLLRGVDRLRAMIDDLHASDAVPCEEELRDLDGILGRATTVDRSPSMEPVSAVPWQDVLRDLDHEAQELLSIVESGRFVYVITLDLTHGSTTTQVSEGLLENFGALGEVLGILGPDGPCINLDAMLAQGQGGTLLYSSVLEPDLIDSALEFPSAAILNLTGDMLGEVPSAPEPEVVIPGVTPLHNAKEGRGETAQTLRVSLQLLGGLMDTAGELVLARNQLLRTLENHERGIPGLGAILQNIDKVTSEVQEGIMQTRMQPVGSIFGKFPRVVRDLARSLGKEIEVTMEGNEVELDKSILECLSDPMTHLIRNCADHALEPPAERIAAGKPRQGAIHLRAFHEGGQVHISIRDTGRGIDGETIARKAFDKGLVSADDVANMSIGEKERLIFAPGFSTAEVLSDVSGRGVGMDVVRSNIEKVGGTVCLHTKLGEGTTIVLQLPLTLAIIPALVVGVEGFRFAIPQVNVEELVWIRSSQVAGSIERIRGQDVLRLRDILLPLIRLSDTLELQRTFSDPITGDVHTDLRARIADRRSDDDEHAVEEVIPAKERDGSQERRAEWRNDYNIVVTNIGVNRFGIIVDILYDMEEIVVKPLSGFLTQRRCFSGATILGDGSVITILDITGVADQAQLRFSNLESEAQRRQVEQARREAEMAGRRHALIVFTGGENELFAIEQDAILRLEKISTVDIETVGDQEYVKFRDHGLPLIRLDRILPVCPLPTNREELFMVIPRVRGPESTDETPIAGILVSNIVDAVEVEVDIKGPDRLTPGLKGTAILNDRLTLFLDPIALLAASGFEGSVITCNS